MPQLAATGNTSCPYNTYELTGIDTPGAFNRKIIGFLFVTELHILRERPLTREQIEPRINDTCAVFKVFEHGRYLPDEAWWAATRGQ